MVFTIQILLWHYRHFAKIACRRLAFAMTSVVSLIK